MEKYVRHTTIKDVVQESLENFGSSMILSSGEGENDIVVNIPSNIHQKVGLSGPLQKTTDPDRKNWRDI